MPTNVFGGICTYVCISVHLQGTFDKREIFGEGRLWGGAMDGAENGTNGLDCLDDGLRNAAPSLFRGKSPSVRVQVCSY